MIYVTVLGGTSSKPPALLLHGITPKMITILGAGGGIANEVVKLLSARKEPFRLVARHARPLSGAAEMISADLSDKDQTTSIFVDGLFALIQPRARIVRGRTCAMTAMMYELLKECVRGKGPEDYVFTRITRKGLKPVKDLRKSWTNLCEKIGRPDLIPHDLRRSAARQLRYAGVAESTIMKTGGWLTSSVFRRYCIDNNKDQKIAMAALEQKRAAEKLEREKEQALAQDSPNLRLDEKFKQHVQNGWKQ
jgi:integrase